jgi:hypothetical protein
MKKIKIPKDVESQNAAKRAIVNIMDYLDFTTVKIAEAKNSREEVFVLQRRHTSNYQCRVDVGAGFCIMFKATMFHTAIAKMKKMFGKKNPTLVWHYQTEKEVDDAQYDLRQAWRKRGAKSVEDGK